MWFLFVKIQNTSTTQKSKFHHSKILQLENVNKTKKRIYSPITPETNKGEQKHNSNALRGILGCVYVGSFQSHFCRVAQKIHGSLSSSPPCANNTTWTQELSLTTPEHLHWRQHMRSLNVVLQREQVTLRTMELMGIAFANTYEGSVSFYGAPPLLVQHFRSQVPPSIWS